MLLAALSLLLVCLLTLLFFKDNKTRSRIKLSEMVPGHKAFPLFGNFLVMIFYFDSEPQVFVCLADSHERNNGTLRHYDFGVTMS